MSHVVVLALLPALVPRAAAVLTLLKTGPATAQPLLDGLVIENGRTGRLIRPGAVHQFAEALKAYIEDPALRTAHGQAGEKRSEAFAWDQINQVVADTYLRLIRQKGAAQG